jgi:2-dehydropantoate 2-reductase
MIRITIAGIGGVGGFLGGKLASHYEGSKDVEIHFISRGENEKAIREHGLKVETYEGTFIAHPASVTSQPSRVGKTDFLICCTKSYDLEESILQLKPLIGNETVILPLLNGVDSYERIKLLLPDANVWQGCVYVVSRLIEPGYVKQSGQRCTLYFGTTAAGETKLQILYKVLVDAGIHAHLPKDIIITIWEKFLFISPLATLTTFLKNPIGAILANEKSKNLMRLLMEELYAVAIKNGIQLATDLIPKTWDMITSLPFDATSSMHSDQQKGKRTEVDSLTGYVVTLGQKLHVPTPEYQRICEALKSRV